MVADVVVADLRPARWAHEDGWGTFRPNGRKFRRGYIPNRVSWQARADETDVWAARLFVGFNVGDQPVHEMDDLVDVVQRVREHQTGNPSSSFLYQQGIYKHEDTGQVVTEPGAQVVILNTPDMDTGTGAFVEQMVRLAEVIARELQQESVVVEIQKNGVTQRVMGVSG